MMMMMKTMMNMRMMKASGKMTIVVNIKLTTYGMHVESSVIAEERAYLRDIQQQRQYYQRRQSSLRPPSAASTQISAITAPSTPLGRPNSAISNRIRRPPVLLQGGDDDSVILDPNVNPWVSSSTKDIDPRQQQQQQQQRRESLLTPSFDPTSPLEHRRESFNRLVSSSSPSYPTAPSPFVSNPSSPARSNITATQEQEQQGTHGTNTSVVSLGPATRRALETLESEIIALNERIDGLKQELRANITNTAPSSSTAPRKKKRTGQWPWRWIVKVNSYYSPCVMGYSLFVDDDGIDGIETYDCAYPAISVLCIVHGSESDCTYHSNCGITKK